MYPGIPQRAANGGQTAAVGYPSQPPQSQGMVTHHYQPAAGGGSAAGMAGGPPVGAGGAAFYPGQSFQPHQQMAQQPAGQREAAVAGQASSTQFASPPPFHGDPNTMGHAEGGIAAPRAALSLFDLAPPGSVDSLPQVAPAEMDELAQLMALALQHRCEEMRPFERSHQSIFHSSRIPGISVWDYIRRIAKYSGCSPECFIIALVMLDRYSQATGVPLSFRNIHRLSITAVMVSAKLRDDIYYSNAYYASIGGVTCKELFHLELELLSTLKWGTWVDASLFFEYVTPMREVYGRFLPPTQR